MRTNPVRGEIYWVDWSPSRGSEQRGRRLALVVQTDAANTNPAYPNTIVVTVSGKGLRIPTHVRVEPSSGNGLKEPSYIKCEQVMTISKDRLDGRIGRLEVDLMSRVDKALKTSLELD